MAGAEKRVLEEEAYGEAFAWATAEISRRLQALGEKSAVICQGAVVDCDFNVEGEYFTYGAACDRGALHWKSSFFIYVFRGTGRIRVDPLSACGEPHDLFLNSCPRLAPPTVGADTNACRTPL